VVSNLVVITWRLQRTWDGPDDSNLDATDKDVDIHDALDVTENGNTLVKDGRYYFARVVHSPA
jgi:hypothetical protein